MVAMAHPYDEFLTRSALSPRSNAWTPADGALPPLFLSHGAPPLLEDGGWMDELFAWAQSLPRPRAVLIVSAHWESAPIALSSPTQGTPLVYDFSGFDPRYYRTRYDTPDATPLARLVESALPQGDGVFEHPTRGLDHGAWVPLLAMYPEADIPVLQLSLPTHDPARLLDLGRRLRPLRDEGVLIIGSGFTTHGLPFLTRAAWAGLEVPSWSRDFDAWAADALARGDVDELAAFRDRAPGMPYAHPTVEHFSPLFVTLGAATDPEAPTRTTIDGYFFGLARRSLQAA
jgi:4,5-DOPA dioxygenase extradiol